MQELDTTNIIELEQIVKEEFTTFIENTETQDVFESVDRIHIFGYYGKNINKSLFLLGHENDIKKLAVKVKKLSLDHYSMPADYKVKKKMLFGHQSGSCLGKKRIHKVIYHTKI